MSRLHITGLCALALTAGCSSTSHDPVFTAFHREAGAIVDNGEFGNATMNNTQRMKGEQQYAYDMAQRFASEVPSSVTFDFDSAVVSAEARETLRRQAHWIRQFPEVRFRVYGHTDKVGSASYNKRLGLRRARAVVHVLVANGIDRGRLEAVVSFGETQPLIVTEGRERRNRRTVTEVSGFVEKHPAVLDGKYAEVVYREYVRSAEPATGLSGISGQDFSVQSGLGGGGGGG